MKKIFSSVLAGLLCITALTLSACTPGGPQSTADPTATPSVPTAEPTATPIPVVELPDVDPASVDVITEMWVATELTFESTKSFEKKAKRDKGLVTMSEASMLIMDAVFTSESGTVLTVPAYWDGGNTFKVRFAPTEHGVWNYVTKCEDDASLNGLTGKIGANSYKGDLEVYKRGFVTAKNGGKYFTYNDGTPFFYLGDTHWSMLTEEFDNAGPNAGDIKTDSHFKYIVDKRIEQGFTVYQSEPIGYGYFFDFRDGIRDNDIKGFQKMDLYFQYLAEKGMTHANAQFFFSTDFEEKTMNDTEYLEIISRYWVARYGAYPVMWTLGQEIDNDMYYSPDKTSPIYSFKNNPWLKVAEFMHKYDAYNHPLTGHQENTGQTTVTGKGTGSSATGGGISLFVSRETTEKTGHDWWGAQWSPSLNSQINDAAPKDYWASEKIAVNYESRYCYLWTKDFGARAQGWISYLSGFMGYGYGAIDMWFYKSSYDTATDSSDGVETVTVADKQTPWSKAIEFESGYQVGYMREFFNTIEWWKLVPDFNDGNAFVADNGTIYTCASNGSDVYVVYLYNQTTSSGTVCNLVQGATYTAKWFNPRTNEYTEIGSVTADTTDKNGAPAYTAPAKPDANDWVLLLTRA